jgi:hypothetical protein
MQYNLWCGISCIASCLQRKCYCNWGPLVGYAYPNLYIALVGPPGGRKGTAMRPAKTMLQDLEIRLCSDALGSSQALYQELSMAVSSYPEHNGKEKEHRSLSVWADEFAVFLSDKDPKLINSLTDLFDSPSNWKYFSLSRKEIALNNCWLNIVGAITPSLLQDRLSRESVGGGLVSRIIFVVGYGPEKLVALPFLSKEEIELHKMLFEDLQQISLLSGPFILTKSFLSEWAHWYENESQHSSIESDKFLGYNSRRATHVKKLVMVISASENDKMEIKAHHLHKAVALMEHNEKEMTNAFQGIGRGQHAEVYTSILSYLENKKSFSFEELSAVFQLDVLPHELETYLESMVTNGKIKRIQSASDPKKIRFDVLHKIKEKQVPKILTSSIFKHLH